MAGTHLVRFNFRHKAYMPGDIASFDEKTARRFCESVFSRNVREHPDAPPVIKTQPLAVMIDESELARNLAKQNEKREAIQQQPMRLVRFTGRVRGYNVGDVVALDAVTAEAYVTGKRANSGRVAPVAEYLADEEAEAVKKDAEEKVRKSKGKRGPGRPKKSDSDS